MRISAATAAAIVAVVQLARGAAAPRPAFAPPQRDRAASVAAGTAAIAGRMTVATQTGSVPVRRARVTLESASLKTTLTTDTDTDGRFRFDKLPAGAYRVTGQKAGFIPAVADPRAAFQKPAPVTLADGQALTVNLPMAHGQAIEGTVRRDNGQPAINVVVSAERLGYDISGRVPMAVRVVRTDDLGRFRIHSLPPGEYLVNAAQDALEAAASATPGPANVQRTVPARTYFPGGPRPGDATPVVVTAGRDATSIDFTLGSAMVGTLLGTVLNAAGEPAIDPSVRIQRVGGPVGEVRGFMTPNTNEFSFRNVPAGDYWFMAAWRPAPGAAPELGVTRLSTSGADQPPIVIRTSAPVAVTGTVEGASLPTSAAVVAFETAYEMPALRGSDAWTWAEPIAADGSFAFPALIGPRLFRVAGLPPDAAIARVFLGDVDVTDTPVDFKSGDAPARVRIVIAPRAGSVSGSIRDAKGAPKSGRVVIFADDEKTWGPRTRTVKVADAGADGRFTVGGLPDGKYFAVAQTFLEDNAWFDADVLRALKAGAAPFTVTGGASVTINLVVKP